MNSTRVPLLPIAGCLVFLSVPPVYAQGRLADYRRAGDLRRQYEAAAVHFPGSAKWLDANRFWYRRSIPGGHEFVIMDATTRAKSPAFDHEKLAAALSQATGTPYRAARLPLTTLNFIDKEQALELNVAFTRWKCTLTDYKCSKIEVTPPGRGPDGQRPLASPDGKWEALAKNFNVYIRPKAQDTPQPPADQGDLPRPAEKPPGFMLTSDGSEGNYYAADSFVWSPDSKKLVAYRVRAGYRRKVNYVESSPADQLQPKFMSIDYAKPGDVLDLQQPVLFVLSERQEVPIDNRLFPNPYRLSRAVWKKDGHAFTFEYNQRGHQVYRVIEADGSTGSARTVIEEKAKTFFCYSGKRFRHDVGDGKEIIWMSERDGWNHLYLFDGTTGKVKNQITKGNWVVRGVDWVDEEHSQIWFSASGMYPGKDPYFLNYYRINFDGSGLTALTHGDGQHEVAYSKDHTLYVDTWSLTDQPPVSEIRRTSDLQTVAEVERADLEPLREAGWHAPEVFTAVGRDGKTDIWGIIYKPSNLDPSKKYPVIENIYAGPQGSFVPKSFTVYNPMQSLAELGFIVVQIDGMGTSNRSKAFHDVAWKNLADAGFPDRILWHKAVAAKYPWYDISRVGIYGTSAGGQNALGGLLFHPEFYKAGVASCGCHDNRMDKIWWNEQWMGWPLGSEYIACSNTENAARLQGKLMLYVGEMDTNVDPSSTLQVVNALIKANKTFDLLVIPGANHTNGGTYGDRKRFDFFVHHLLGVEPPDWNENVKIAELVDTLLPQEPEIDEAASFVEP